MEEPWLLKFRIETCGGGEVKNGVAEEVVSLGAVTATRTYQAMVAELIQDAIAQGAYAVRFEQRNPEPPKNRCPKQEGIDIVLLRRRRTCMEPSACARKSSKLQVSPARWVVERRGSFKLVEVPFVGAPRSPI